MSMEKAEVSRLINSFNAIKGYFDTTTKYMPQIAKLVIFIEDVIPLLNTIHANINQSTALIPKATEKLGKVTSATEMATTEVMDIVDKVIGRLNRMTAAVEIITTELAASPNAAIAGAAASITEEVDGGQEDLFAIMNALQFQDITTQQINAIGDTIAAVQEKLSGLLQGFQEDGVTIEVARKVAFDPNAEYDFSRSAASQAVVDELMKATPANTTDTETAPVPQADATGDIALGEDGQPDIDAIMRELKKKS